MGTVNKTTLDHKPIDVVVLASGVNRIPLFPGDKPGNKALIPFHGKSSLCRVLDALDAVPDLGRIRVEGPVEQLGQEIAKRTGLRQVDLIEGGETFVESLVRGLEHFRSAKRVLFVNADLPLLTPAAVDAFLDAMPAEDPDHIGRLFVSAVPEPAFRGLYARPTKPFNGYRGMRICHGNIFAVDPGLLDLPGLRKRIDALYRGRKNAVTSTLALGLDIALVYMLGVELFHWISLPEMARYVSRRYGFGIVPVVLPWPELTEDVDEPDDYTFVETVLEKRQVQEERKHAACVSK
jgi:CTP:molybdopterin cytidylyltransferase MocA